MAGMEAQTCNEVAMELRQALQVADDRWRAFEARLEDAEERAISEHSDDLRKWFGTEVSDSLTDWTAVGLRRKTRDRVQKLLLAPLDERIRLQVPLPHAQLSSADGSAPLAGPGEIVTDVQSHPIDVLLEHWDGRIQPMLDEASREDAKIAKKLRRLEKVGAVGNIKNEQQRQIALWTPVRGALEAAEGPTRALVLLLDTELRDEALTQAAAAVPGIVARSMCDWHFQHCVAELEQLSNWWEGARAALQRLPDLWERLLEQEGLFVRRIERGIGELLAEKSRYTALANFGHRDRKSVV